ncbi:tRNA lysidine(34) synthetase TilS [Caenimonas terrae]|uniref:tRNA(Ile)-lysidine synthase n=1 Tax=Caenimonas terrae TaxID=696074 RepID=A0ABW0NGV2_9BURK
MPSTVTGAIASFSPALPLAVAYSGGADSTALLVACARKWPGQVRAVHVHHGLQAAADSFEQHCAAACRQLGVPLAVRRVDARHAPGQSPEDAARRSRYAALTAALQQEWGGAVKDIALAQHADDQVETMLLALSRGAGLPGLAAMPARWQRDGITWHRPLLKVPGPAIRQWLADEKIAWIEDPTNADDAFTRNRIRARLLPALEQAFPQFRETFARSAGHAAQAQQVLDEIARQDLERTGTPPAIKQLQTLSTARQANALRLWLRREHQASASAAQLAELLDQVAACTTRGHAIRIKVGHGFVQRQGDRLAWAMEPSATL